MATSRLVGIQDAAGMIKYCLSARGKAKEPVGERVLQVHSSLLAGGDDLQGMLSELKLHAGTKYEAYHLRASFSPDERIDPAEFPAFCSALQERVLGGRAGIAVMHGDSNCQHVHFVSSFKDESGKIINNKGKGKWTAAARLQHDIDAVCRDFNLSTLAIPEGDIFRSSLNSPLQGKVRRSLAEIRMKENSRESFVSNIRHEIARAVKSSSDFSSFSERLSAAGVTMYSRGASLVFMDAQGRKVRLSKMYSGLKDKKDIEELINKSNRPQKSGAEKEKDMLEFVLSEEQRGAARERAAREGEEKQRQKRQKAESTARKIAEKIMNGESPYEASRSVRQEEREKEYEAKKRERDEEYKEQKEQREREYEKKQAERKSEIEADRAKAEIQRAVSGLGVAEINALCEGNFLPAAIALSKALGAAGMLVKNNLRPKPGEGLTMEQGRKVSEEVFKPTPQDEQDQEPDDHDYSFGPGR